MAGKTKALSGPGKDKFLRAIASGATDKAGLLEILHVNVPEIRVRLEVWKDTLRGKAVDDVGGGSSSVASSEPQAGKTVADTKAFDPFAFSAVALLTRQGRAALEAKLAAIAAGSDLRALADAQHLAVDQSVTDAAHLRSAIIAGAERRIAERIAAAS
jgi:hypothetical protein